jgi:hypothetical protein
LIPTLPPTSTSDNELTTMVASELRKTKHVAAKAQANTGTEEPTESAWLGFEEKSTAADGITSAEAKMRSMMSKMYVMRCLGFL